MNKEIINYLENSVRYYVKAVPLFDADMKLVDLELRYINAAFLSFLHMNLEEIENKKLSEVFPIILEDALEWSKDIEDSFLNNKVVSKEGYSTLLETWANMEIFREDEFVNIFLLDQSHIYDKLENYKKLTEFSLKYLEFEYGNLDYQLLSDNILEVIKAEYVFITYFDYETGKIKMKSASGMPEMLDRLERITNKTFLSTEWNMENFELPSNTDGVRKIDVSDVYKVFDVKDEATRKLITRSMKIGEAYVGYITYQSQILGNIYVVMPPNTKNDDLEILNSFCSQLGILILRKKAEEEILYLNFHDKLTGLYNKRFFEEEMHRLDTPRQIPLSIIMGDVNGLKLVNDAFGHIEGDRFLKKVAFEMKNTCRTEDIVARIGGDEFAVILPNVGYKEALEIIDRINENCKKDQEHPIKLTVSLGAATKKSAEQDISDIFKLAEDRMYSKKISESRKIKADIIADLFERLYMAFPDKKRHMANLVKIAEKFAKELNISEIDKNDLEMLCKAHDLGNIAIKTFEIANRNSSQNEIKNYLKLHSEIGFRIAASTVEYAHIAEYILKHHEKWDGTGIPLGLKELEIPLVVRIFSLIDFYNDFMDNSELEDSKKLELIKSKLVEKSGKDFEPCLVDKFIEIIS